MTFIYYIYELLTTFAKSVHNEPSDIFNATVSVFLTSLLISAAWTTVVLLKANVPNNFFQLIFLKKDLKINQKDTVFNLLCLVLISYVLIFCSKVFISLSKEATYFFNFFEKNGYTLSNRNLGNSPYSGTNYGYLEKFLIGSESIKKSAVSDSLWVSKSLGLGNGWGWDFLVPATSDFVGIVQLYLIIMTVLVSVSVAVTFMFKFSSTDRIDQTINLFNKFGPEMVRTPEFLIINKKNSNLDDSGEYTVLYGSSETRPVWHFEKNYLNSSNYCGLEKSTHSLKINFYETKKFTKISKLIKYQGKNWFDKIKPFTSIEEGMYASVRNRRNATKWKLPKLFKKKYKINANSRSEYGERYEFVVETLKKNTILGKALFSMPRIVFEYSLRKIKNLKTRKSIRRAGINLSEAIYSKFNIIVVPLMIKFHIFEFLNHSFFERAFSERFERYNIFRVLSSQKKWDKVFLKNMEKNRIESVESLILEKPDFISEELSKGVHRNLKIVGGSLSWHNLEHTRTESGKRELALVEYPTKTVFEKVMEDLLVYRLFYSARSLYYSQKDELYALLKKYINCGLKELENRFPQIKNIQIRTTCLNFVSAVKSIYTKYEKTISSLSLNLDSLLNMGLLKKKYNNKNDLYSNYLPFFRFLTAQSVNKFWVYHSAIEFAWTIIPCLILVFVSVPSFALALALDENFKPQLWVKVVGNQWFWVYEYSSYDEYVVIDSVIQQGSDLKTNALRLLAPDTTVTIPYNKFVRFLVTSVDVIHSWAVPSLGVKVDACPGRINSVSILPNRLGIFYGQCSEICGVNHAFMPIAVEVIA